MKKNKKLKLLTVGGGGEGGAEGGMSMLTDSTFFLGPFPYKLVSKLLASSAFKT